MVELIPYFNPENEKFANSKSYINGIESFWAFAKTRPAGYP